MTGAAQTGPSGLRVYRVLHEGDHRYVEAPTMSRAIELWRSHEAILAEVEPDEIGDPDGCDLADDMPVIRAAKLRPAAAPADAGVLADLFALAASVKEFAPIFGDACRRVDMTNAERVANELWMRAKKLCEQTTEQRRKLIAVPKGGAA